LQSRESVTIVHFITDEDGSLKIKQMDDFRDSKAHLQNKEVAAAAILAANKK
jgi:hypothetical protein